MSEDTNASASIAAGSEDLYKKIKDALIQSEEFSSRGIEILLQDTRVQLKGYVTGHRQKLAVGRIVRSIPGVKSCDNKLRVRNPQWQDDASMLSAAQQALKSSLPLDSLTILLEVRAGRIHLQGNVSEAIIADIAADVVLSVPGVKSLSNLVLVDPQAQARDIKKARMTQIYLHYSPAFHSKDLDIRVADRQAQISGRVPRKKLKAIAESVVRRFCEPRRLISSLRVDAKATA